MISRVWEATTAKRMQIDPYCQQWKCSPVNVVSSNIRVMQIFAGVRARYIFRIFIPKAEIGHPFNLCQAIKHDKLTQCCRAFTLALARLSCIKTRKLYVNIGDSL